MNHALLTKVQITDHDDGFGFRHVYQTYRLISFICSSLWRLWLASGWTATEGDQVFASALALNGKLVGVTKKRRSIVPIPWESCQAGGDRERAKGFGSKLGEAKVANLALKTVGD
jgi:hypothetical protein